MRDLDIEQFVRLSIENRYEEIDRRVEREELPQWTAEAQSHGVLWSSSTVDGEARIRERAAREKIRVRIEAEKEVHRRKDVQISNAEAEVILAEIETMIDAEIGKFFASGPTARVVDESSGLGDRFREEARGGLLREARNRVGLAVVESKLPPVPGEGGSVTINVSAPNFGVVAARVEKLDFGGRGDELKQALRSVLEASNSLPKSQAEEVREIVDGLATEAEPGRDENDSLIRAAARRLGDLLRASADAASVLGQIDKIPYLFEVLRRLVGG